jgi:hypothetical protein
VSNQQDQSRREFVKKAAYIAPAILTLQAAPQYAKAGSNKPNPSTTPPGRPAPGLRG